ncbi:MAG: SdpI family protein [bacterium]
MLSLRRWYPLALALLGIAISLAVLDRLPARLATHWDLEGTPNGWMPRSLGAFVMPVLLLMIWGVMRVAPIVDPRRLNYEKFTAAYDIAVATILTLLFATHLMVLALGLGYHVSVTRVAPATLGILFVSIGNVMPLVRSNFMLGIRTPWTLSNDRVWARTHRLGGYTMTAAGVAIVTTAALLPASAIHTVILTTIVVALGIPVVYSYFTWKREMKR